MNRKREYIKLLRYAKDIGMVLMLGGIVDTSNLMFSIGVTIYLISSILKITVED